MEQTETPEQLEIRRREKGTKDKVILIWSHDLYDPFFYCAIMFDKNWRSFQVVKREICAVVTKGTLTEGEMLSTNPDPSYMLAVTESCQISANEQGVHIFGICAVDAATSRIIIGQVG